MAKTFLQDKGMTNGGKASTVLKLEVLVKSTSPSGANCPKLWGGGGGMKEGRMPLNQLAAAASNTSQDELQSPTTIYAGLSKFMSRLQRDSPNLRSWSPIDA